MQTEGNKNQTSFNEASQKVVNWDEYDRNKFDLEWQKYTPLEKAFDGLINTPYKVFLFVRRGISEAIDMFRGKEDQNAGKVYEDKLSRSHYYFDRDNLESDIAYNLKHGLSRKFQEKAAAIAREAFDNSRDFSVLVKTGQLQNFVAGL